jgi:CHAD domain-containing protein
VNLDAAVAGETSEPLHDIRVAIRRLRSLLRVFRKHLPDQPRQEIDELLVEISEEIGPVRDLDEWVDFLQSTRVRSITARSRLFPAYVRHHQQRRQLAYATVRRCLRGRHFASQRLKINRLLREELPRLSKIEPPGSLLKFAARQLDKALRRARKHERLRRSTSPEKLHELRIALRKVRYLAEFFAPVLGDSTAKLAKRLHQVERVLGRIHDVDMGMEHLTREGPLPPRALADHLTRQREQSLRELDKVWRRVADPVLRDRVKEELAAAQHPGGGEPARW